LGLVPRHQGPAEHVRPKRAEEHRGPSVGTGNFGTIPLRLMSPLSTFHPAVRAWFEHALGPPTEAQARGWAEIARGDDTLICAPTGHGKTLAAFLSSLDRLVKRGDDGGAGHAGTGIEVVYVSPLKALS